MPVAAVGLPSGDERHRAKYGDMDVIATDQFKGRLYRCACGARVWSCWGNAEKHAIFCEQSGRPTDALA